MTTAIATATVVAETKKNTTITTSVKSQANGDTPRVNFAEEIQRTEKNAWAIQHWEVRKENSASKKAEVCRKAIEACIKEQLDLAAKAILDKKPVGVVKYHVAFAWAYANHIWVDIKARVSAMYQDSAGKKLQVHLEFVQKLGRRTNPGAKVQVAEHIRLARVYAEYLNRRIDREIASALGSQAASQQSSRNSGHGPKQHAGIQEVAAVLDSLKATVQQNAEMELVSVG